MKALLCAAILFVQHAYADETTDRVAIGLAITALNESAQNNALFSGKGRGEYERLTKANSVGFRIIGPAADHPAVKISHEPWGEATINLSESRPDIAFVTPDVALAEGACSYEDSDAAKHTTPLLFVMKKIGEEWKIASIRALAR